MSSFDDAFSALIGNEGGYSNNPKDPGGETMWGVTARIARAHGYTGEMRDLPIEMAKAIAKAVYWNPYRCDDLPPKVAFEVLDVAYNGGYPAKWLQLAVGTKPDGKVGPLTIAAAGAQNVERTVMRMCAYRISYYASLRAWPTFGRGWANRVASNLLQGAA